MNRGLLLALLWPALALAWEEEQALAFILAYHPVVAAQRSATASYQPPGAWRRVLEHTSVYVRAASGTSSTVSESGDTTTSDPMTVGIQVNIPLASPRERREYAQQALAEATRIDEVRSRALTDLAKLRELEAERAVVRARLAFQKSRLLAVRGRWERVDGVEHLIAGDLRDLSEMLGELALPSRDFH